MSQSKSSIAVAPVAGHIGGVDLRTPLAGEQVQAIRAALLKHEVIFFRGQHIDHAQQIESNLVAAHESPSAPLLEPITDDIPVGVDGRPEAGRRANPRALFRAHRA